MVTFAFWPTLLFIYVTLHNKFCIRIFPHMLNSHAFVIKFPPAATFFTILYREWDWYRSSGQFWSYWMHLRRSLSIQIVREYSSNNEMGGFWRLNGALVTMSWVCNAPQNVTMNTCNVYQPVALPNVSWNVDGLWMHVLTVSKLHSLIPIYGI